MPNFDLLSWGANSHHQLSHGIESEQCLIPKAVDFKNELGLRVSDIKKVTGGAGHSLILTEKGAVYSCGLNNKGQAGKPRSVKCLVRFENIEELKYDVIVDVAAGWDSSMAINEKGDIYAWGSNAYGQLGEILNPGICGQKLEACFYGPKKINIHEILGAGDPVAKIAMGLRHSVLVTNNGKVLVAGNGNKCQLGLIDSANKPIRKTMSFTQVPELFGIKTAACGQHHTMALTKTGDLFVWGDNKHGQLGLDARKYPRVETPLKLKTLNIGLDGEIFTGWTHTAVLYDGKVLAWGRNTYGQLGRGESDVNKFENWVPEVVKNVPKFIQLAIGSEHNVALGEDGSIVSWGWNEHGNCGTGNDQDVRSPTFIKVPKNVSGTIVGTGAGHSFAVVKNESEL